MSASKTKSTGTFLKLPHELLERRDVRPQGMIVLAAILALMTMRKRAAFSANEIAEHLRWPLRNVQRAVHHLVANGDLVTATPEPDGRMTRYEIPAEGGNCAPEVAHISAPEVAPSCAPEVAQRYAPDLVEKGAGSGAQLAEVSLFPVVKNPPGEEGRASARETTTSPVRGLDPGAAVDEARRLLRAGYADRFRRETGDAWQGSSGNRGYIDDVAAYVVETAHGDLAGRVTAILDGYFGGRPDLARLRWPWKYLAEDPGRYAGAAADAARAAALDAVYAEIDTVKAKIDLAVGERRLDDIPPLEAELERIKARGRAMRDAPRKPPATHGGRRVVTEPTGTREAFEALRGRAS